MTDGWDRPRNPDGTFAETPDEPNDRLDPAPGSIPCPCGTGEATLTRTPIVEPFTFDGSKQAVHYHYRHSGCHIGGTVVVVEGAAHRRVGPLFDPGRYGGPVGAMATDGGTARKPDTDSDAPVTGGRE